MKQNVDREVTKLLLNTALFAVKPLPCSSNLRHLKV